MKFERLAPRCLAGLAWEMNLFQAIAPVISNGATVTTVVLLLAAWAVASASFLFQATGKLKRALSEGAQVIAEAATPLDFREHYETIRARLLTIAVLRARWRDFADSLIVPRDRGRPLQATARPDRWFDLGLLGSKEIGLSLRYHAALPNLLVGAGLLFTFLGLAVALSSASGIVSDGAGQRDNALRQLLDTASFKFITSLAGLFLSIAYTVIYKSQLKSVDRSLELFIDAIDERVPPVTAASLQQESNALLERQVTFAESLANDLSMAMQQAFDQAFDHRLGEHIKPLREAMEALASRISGSNEDAIKTMLDSFLSRLQGGAGDRMQDVATSLAGLGQSLGELQTGLGEAAARMAESANTMAQRMGEGAEAALARITVQMDGLAENLRAVAEQTRGAGAEAGRELAQRLGVASSGFEAASHEIAAALSRAAAGAGETMRSGGAEGAVLIKSALGEAGSAMGASISMAADALASAGGQAGASLRRGGDEAATRLTEAGGAFGGRAQSLGSQVEALTRTTEGVVHRLSEFNTAARDAAGPLASISNNLRVTSEALRDTTKPLAMSAEGVGRAIEQLSTSMQRFEATQAKTSQLADGMRGAAERFSGIDGELAKVLSELQTGLQGFAQEVSRCVRETDGQLARAVTQLQGLLEDLQSTLEDMGPVKPQPSGTRRS